MSGIENGVNLIHEIIKMNTSNTKDGKISSVKQGGVGDCGVISPILAMSYTDKGSEMIDSMLEYTTHELSTVHSYLGDEKISNSTLAKYTKRKIISNGDDDMGLLELAVQNEIDAILKNEYEIQDDAPFELKYLKENSLTNYYKKQFSIDGVFPSATFYLLTGKEGKFAENKGEMNMVLNEFQNNNHEDLAITAVSYFSDGYDYIMPKTNDISMAKNFINLEINEPEVITSDHAFAVKNVDDNGITLVNPWDSSKSITISRSDFLNNFYIMYCDLSDENEPKDYITKK